MAAITKGEFASRRGVTPGRVSQWLAEGKISGAAVIGVGRLAKIDEALACEQLAETLDFGQRGGNGHATDLTFDGPGMETTSRSIDRQIQAQRLLKIERENRQAVAEEAIANGRLLDAAEARQHVTREIGQLLVRLEGSLPELATAIAGQFKLPQRDVLHLLRAKWREVRMAASIEARERAEPLPESVGFEL